jgi:hypothetical protein
MKSHAEGTARKYFHKGSQSSNDYIEFRLKSAASPEAKALARTGNSTPFELFARLLKKGRPHSAQ